VLRIRSVPDRGAKVLPKPTNDESGDVGLLLRALEFSADKHRTQRRKDVDASPYINHPIAVAAVLANVGGVRSMPVLCAAVLHDTIEDTETTPEELDAAFGREIRLLVEEVTDDKQLPKDERKRLQIEHAPHLSPAAKHIKLGDKISNIQDVADSPPAKWSGQRRREYLDWAEQVVAGCRGVRWGIRRLPGEGSEPARSRLREPTRFAKTPWQVWVGTLTSEHGPGLSSQRLAAGCVSISA
jgi:GTP diphosphokinase / guanosine-3',5'-bis(diphosphate) 3'-diphosphatase